MVYTDHIRVDPAYGDVLRAAGLDCVDAVLSQTDGRVAAWSRTTDTLFVPGPGCEAGFYVKRYHYARWGKRIRGTFRGTFFGSHRGRAEFRLLSEMRTLGLPAVRPVAYGARRLGHFVTACFLITEEVPDACNLTTFACDVIGGRVRLTLAQRREITCRLARQIAELHAAGFVHGQLFWRNVLIRFGPTGEPEFFFLDVRPRRGGRRLNRAGHWWLRELAHVAASALPFTSFAERLRFLNEYYGARRLSPDFKNQIRQIDLLSRRWSQHERQRIKMNDLFEAWNRELDGTAGPGAPLATSPGTSP